MFESFQLGKRCDRRQHGEVRAMTFDRDESGVMILTQGNTQVQPPLVFRGTLFAHNKILLSTLSHPNPTRHRLMSDRLCRFHRIGTRKNKVYFVKRFLLCCGGEVIRA